MKHQKGGTPTCNRVETDDINCITVRCVDYQKGKFNSKPETVCYNKSEWLEFFDEVVQSKYWYNQKTGESTWINPINKKKSPIKIADTNNKKFDELLYEGGKSKKRRRKRKTNRKRKTKRNKKA